MDKALTGYIVAAAMLALFLLGWKPLHRRFRGWAIVAAYMMFLFAVASMGSVKPHAQWVPVFFAVIGILVLFANRQKPIEERRPTVEWAVIHGLWDQLEKQGLPRNEIERLKRLTPEERAALMAEIRVPLKREKPRWEPSEHFDIYNGDADEYRCL